MRTGKRATTSTRTVIDGSSRATGTAETTKRSARTFSNAIAKRLSNADSAKRRGWRRCRQRSSTCSRTMRTCRERWGRSAMKSCISSRS